MRSAGPVLRPPDDRPRRWDWWVRVRTHKSFVERVVAAGAASPRTSRLCFAVGGGELRSGGRAATRGPTRRRGRPRAHVVAAAGPIESGGHGIRSLPVVVRIQVLPEADFVPEPIGAGGIGCGEDLETEVSAVEAVPNHRDRLAASVRAESAVSGEQTIQISPRCLLGATDSRVERLVHLHLR